MLSTKPVIVTFGCADTGPDIATSAMTTKRKTPTLLITASSCGCEHLGYRRYDIQTITNTCRKQCDREGFTPEPPVEASETRLRYPPFPRAFSRSAAAWPNGDSGDSSRALRKAARASSLR